MKNLVEQFKEKLDSITPEEFEKSWREIENMGIGSEKPCVFDPETNNFIFFRPRNEQMKQEEINGEHIEINFDNFIKMSDILYDKEPLLSHYIGPDNTNYLFYWVDNDKKLDRWFIIKTDISKIYDYLTKKISLYSIITNSNGGYITDIDNNNKYHNSKRILIEDLPLDYLPKEDSYY